MKTNLRDFIWDICAGSSAVLAFVSFIELTKQYHGISGLTGEEIWPLTYLLISWVVLAVYAEYCRISFFVSRAWLCASTVIAIWVRFGALAVQTYGGVSVCTAVLAAAFVGYVVSNRSSPRVWGGVRRVVFLVPWLFISLPLIEGVVLSKPLVWIEAAAAENKTATVVLLFDEMSANVSQGLQSELRQQGMDVAFKAVLPVHDSTVKVIPALFNGGDFKKARPCGLMTVCGERSSLAFDEISVQRPDVDVVAFWHPYCEIRGLRYCVRSKISHSIWDAERWICAA